MEKFRCVVSSQVGYKLCKHNGKEYHIPQKELDNLMKNLDISEEEAIELWLDDNDITSNEEAENLTKKAKMNKTEGVNIRKKETKPRNRQPTVNPDKENLIQLIAEALSVPTSITDIKITNKTKYITFRLNDKDFEINLVEKRKKK